MAYQAVFKRYELKYLLTLQQKETIMNALSPYVELDKYGIATIRNVYFDTNNYRLIRRSLEKPIFKEKMRIRSYSKATPDSEVFVELKKKFEDIVYKRRVSMSEREVITWLGSGDHCKKKTQITNEIDYFVSYYGTLHPVLFLSYNREAYYCKETSDFRITFDNNILCRQDDLSLESDIGGNQLLEDNKFLMEIKCSGGVPLWMVNILTKEQIYKTSFSKYGTAYQQIIFPQLQGGYK